MWSFIKKIFQIVILAIVSVGISILMSFISKKGTDFSNDVEPLNNCILAKSNQVPHHAWIQFDGNYKCSGTFIHKQYVLTLAHCVIEFIDKDAYKTKMKVFLGTRTIPLGTPYDVEKITCHESYNPKSFKDDIAVLKLKEEVSRDEDIRPISLPMKNKNLYEGLKLVTSGYRGLDAPNLSGVRVPSKKVDQHIFPMRVVSSETCQKYFSNKDLSGKFCAIADYGYPQCLGDGGSPAYIVKKYIVGLYSVCSYNILQEKRPELFIDVSSYIDFIKLAMGQQV